MFNIMSVDPGSTTIGVSIFTINSIDLSVVNVETMLIDTRIGFVEDNLNKDLLIRLLKLSDSIRNIVQYYNPLIIVIEDSFINRLRPTAVIPLAQSIFTIESTAISVDRYVKIFKFPPKKIKSVVRDGKAGKEDMLIGIENIKEISSRINVYNISEHEIDALAIGYTMLKHLEQNRSILLML